MEWGDRVGDTGLDFIFLYQIYTKNKKAKEKETIKEVKRNPTEREETFTAETSDKALNSRIYKLLKKQENK